MILQGIVFYALTALAADAHTKTFPAPTVAAEFVKLGKGVDDVTLTDQSGQPVHWRDLNGHPRALFFGFTHCPVICPVTVWELDAAIAKLGPVAKDLQIVFVSLDPDRDTPKVLKDYFSSFATRVRGMTGKQADIDRVAKAFEVQHERVALDGKDYTLDHTAAVFLIDEHGTVVDTLAYGTPQDVTEKRLRQLLTPTLGK
jgi:protein SCO1/2